MEGKARVLISLLVSLTLIAGCTGAVTPKAQDQLPRPWQEWTPQQRGSVLQMYFDALKHDDGDSLAKMLELLLDDIPAIVSDLLEISDTPRRSVELGWDTETYTADELVLAAELMADFYALRTGHTGPQEQVTTHKMQIQATHKMLVRAAELWDEGHEALHDDPQLALSKFTEALEIFRAINVPFDEAGVLLNIGVVCFELKEFDQALEYHEQALAVAEHEDAYTLAADILCNLASLYYLQGQPEKGEEAVSRALHMAQASGDETKYKEIQERLASFLTVTPEPQDQLSRPWEEWTPEQKGAFLRVYIRTAKHDDVKLAQIVESQLENIPAIVSDSLEMSSVAWRWGEIGWDSEPYTADEWLQAAESMATLYAKQTGDNDLREMVITQKLWFQAAELGDEGYEDLNENPQLALTKFLEVLEIYRTINACIDEAKALFNIGVAYFGLRDFEQSLTYHEQALAVAEHEDAYTLAADILCNLAALYHLQGQPEKGNEAVLRALEMAEASDDESKLGEIQERLAPFLDE